MPRLELAARRTWGRRPARWVMGQLTLLACEAPEDLTEDTSRVVLVRRADADGPASISFAGAVPRETHGTFVLAVLPVAARALTLQRVRGGSFERRRLGATTHPRGP